MMKPVQADAVGRCHTSFGLCVDRGRSWTSMPCLLLTCSQLSLQLRFLNTICPWCLPHSLFYSAPLDLPHSTNPLYWFQASTVFFPLTTPRPPAYPVLPTLQLSWSPPTHLTESMTNRCQDTVNVKAFTWLLLSHHGTFLLSPLYLANPTDSKPTV